ncbi:MAG: hypothetical protein IBX55_01600 [Methyloprofundus sp.]|nr:hypothetical protein [Methyloprofundus sp.]
MVKILVGYAVFTGIWFAGLILVLLYKKWVGSSIAKIKLASVEVKNEIYRNFGYGFLFSGTLGVLISALTFFLTASVGAFNFSILFVLAVFLATIGLRMIANSI